jgi:hypothetical protein
MKTMLGAVRACGHVRLARVPLEVSVGRWTYASISEIAAVETIDRGYVGSIPRLTHFAPDLVEAILDGRLSGVGLSAFLKPFQLEWQSQRRTWLCARYAVGPKSTCTSAQDHLRKCTNQSNVHF